MGLGQDFDILYERRLLESDPIKLLYKSIGKPKVHGNPRTYCMDFDGVLNYHETGSGPGPITELLQPAIKAAKQIKAAGHKLVILTARPEEQWHDIEGFLKGQGVKVDAVTNQKPIAEMYIDDRGMRWPRNLGHGKARENGSDGAMNMLDGRRYKSLATHEAIESFGRTREGGPGSGDHGHAGRPGEVGGSGGGGGDQWRKTGVPQPEKKFGPREKPKPRQAMPPGKGIARMMFGKGYKELDKDQKKLVRQELKARGVIRPQGKQEASEGEKELQNAKQVNISKLGGGVSETHIVTMENGLQGVFKTSSNENKQEVASWQVAKLAGYEDIHPPVVFRDDIKDKNGNAMAKGSLMKFWDGKRASSFSDKESEKKYDGTKDLCRTAGFDYVIGNFDRHDNNWLVSSEGKIQLIDHGRALGFGGIEPGVDFRPARHWFSREVQNREDSHDKELMKPSEVAKPFVEKKQEIMEALRKTGIKEQTVKAVGDRIDRLARKDSWKGLLATR